MCPVRKEGALKKKLLLSVGALLIYNLPCLKKNKTDKPTHLGDLPGSRALALTLLPADLSQPITSAKPWDQSEELLPMLCSLFFVAKIKIYQKPISPGSRFGAQALTSREQSGSKQRYTLRHRASVQSNTSGLSGTIPPLRFPQALIPNAE